ncbi:MAG: GNAT family N-acetyltransferase [Chloroflexota bacterium]
MNTNLSTKRLILSPLSLNDVNDLFAMFSDEKAMRFMPTPPHQNVDETQKWFEFEMSRSGETYWAIRLQGEDKIIGHVNFLGETRFPGMGYMISPDNWGKGYATEACQAVLAHGFEQLAHDRVELWINEANGASRRVAEKLGFKLKGRIPQKYSHETEYHFMMVYGMLAKDWHNKPVKKSLPARMFGVEPVLMVHDLVKTVEFYRDKLGFKVDFMYGEPANHASVSQGEWTGSTVTIQITQVSKDRELMPSSYLYIFVDTNLTELFKQYRDSGVEIVSEPERQPWGLQEFVVKDLNGHIIIFGRHL